MNPPPACLLLLLVLLADPLAAQQASRESPVFKRAKPPDQIPLPRQNDVVYEVWQTFLVGRQANAGDPLAQHEYGLRFLTGRGIDADTVQAALWIRKAAEQRLVPALFNLGILSYNGWGTPWNPFEAYRHFRDAAGLGMAEAQYAVGVMLQENLVVPQSPQEALAWVRKAAEGGAEGAKEALKDFERRAAAAAAESSASPPPTVGPTRTAPVLAGVDDDTAAPGEGRFVLETALGSASPEGRRALGLAQLAENPRGVDSATVKQILAAADAGSPEALAVLGRCHDLGIEVRKDAVAAAACYFRALRLDNARVAGMLYGIVARPEFLPGLRRRAEEAEAEARFVWAGLAGVGFDGALAAGQSYLTPQQAVEMLRLAAGQGYVPALIELGLAYLAGRGVRADEHRALELWREAADRGSREAAIRLAVTVVREDPRGEEAAAAVRTIASGALEGSLLAEFALGYCYEEGVGVPQRPPVAARLFRTAAARGSQDAYRALRRMHDAIRPSGPEFAITD